MWAAKLIDVFLLACIPGTFPVLNPRRPKIRFQEVQAQQIKDHQFQTLTN